ncbi:MAG: hypothetical protein QXK93_02165 [Candidatus Bathyarchaeia archaeon]|nr:hypothetical protein [Candidatus Bathyarchaeota archaeon]
MTSTKHASNPYFQEKDKANSLTCDKCGEVFGKPILVTVSSNSFSKTSYYACPRCLTKVKEAAPHPDVEANIKGSIEVSKSEDCGKTKEGCPHFLGFLKKRPKNMPIPDGCLTCVRMIECLT